MILLHKNDVDMVLNIYLEMSPLYKCGQSAVEKKNKKTAILVLALQQNQTEFEV